MAASAAAAGSFPGFCPSYAVICSFLERYGPMLDLPELTFSQLERYIQDTSSVPKLLVDLHVKLLRKIGKSVSADRWEKHLVKICQEFNTTLAWELEKKGYKEMTVESKTGILKYLCESQFDDNVKFKTAINDEDPEKMRLQPIGRDKDGLMYWFQQDQDNNIRVYVEEQDDLDGSSWKCIVRERNDLAEILALLKTQIDPSLLTKKEGEEGTEGENGRLKKIEDSSEDEEDRLCKTISGVVTKTESKEEEPSPNGKSELVAAGPRSPSNDVKDDQTKSDIRPEKPDGAENVSASGPAIKEEPMEVGTDKNAQEPLSQKPPVQSQTDVGGEEAKKKSAEELQRAMKSDQQAKMPLKKREMKLSEDFDNGGSGSIIVRNPSLPQVKDLQKVEEPSKDESSKDTSVRDAPADQVNGNIQKPTNTSCNNNGLKDSTQKDRETKKDSTVGKDTPAVAVISGESDVAEAKDKRSSEVTAVGNGPEDKRKELANDSEDAMEVTTSGGSDAQKEAEAAKTDKENPESSVRTKEPIHNEAKSSAKPLAPSKDEGTCPPGNPSDVKREERQSKCEEADGRNKADVHGKASALVKTRTTSPPNTSRESEGLKDASAPILPESSSKSEAPEKSPDKVSWKDSKPDEIKETEKRTLAKGAEKQSDCRRTEDVAKEPERSDPSTDRPDGSKLSKTPVSIRQDKESPHGKETDKESKKTVGIKDAETSSVIQKTEILTQSINTGNLGSAKETSTSSVIKKADKPSLEKDTDSPKRSKEKGDHDVLQKMRKEDVPKAIGTCETSVVTKEKSECSTGTDSKGKDVTSISQETESNSELKDEKRSRPQLDEPKHAEKLATSVTKTSVKEAEKIPAKEMVKTLTKDKENVSSKESTKDAEKTSKTSAADAKMESTKDTSKDREKTAKSSATDTARDSIKDKQRISTKDAEKESAKETVKTSAKDTEKEATRDKEKISTKETDKLSTKETDKVSTKETDKVSTKETDKVSTKETDKVSTKETDKVSTKEREKASTKETDKASTKETEKVSTKDTAKETVKTSATDAAKESTKETEKMAKTSAKDALKDPTKDSSKETEKTEKTSETDAAKEPREGKEKTSTDRPEKPSSPKKGKPEAREGRVELAERETDAVKEAMAVPTVDSCQVPSNTPTADKESKESAEISPKKSTDENTTVRKDSDQKNEPAKEVKSKALSLNEVAQDQTPMDCEEPVKEQGSKTKQTDKAASLATTEGEKDKSPDSKAREDAEAEARPESEIGEKNEQTKKNDKKPSTEAEESGKTKPDRALTDDKLDRKTAEEDKDEKRDPDRKEKATEGDKGSSEVQEEGIRLKIKIPAHRRKAELLREERGDSESDTGEGRSLRRSPRICRPTPKVVEFQDRKLERKQAAPRVEKGEEKEEEEEEEEEDKEKGEEEAGDEEKAVQKKPREKKLEEDGQPKIKGRKRRRTRWSNTRTRRKKKGSDEEDYESSDEDDSEDEDDSDEDYKVERNRKRRNRNRQRRSSDESTSSDDDLPPNDDPCKHCGLPNHPELILLCDSCDNGYHTACLRPPLMIIPDGEWFCPPCQHKQLCDRLEEQLLNLDTALKKRERAERRKERLVYVGISVENIITPSVEVEEEKEEEEEVIKVKKEVKKSKSWGRRSTRAKKSISYRFDEFDEAIEEAIEEDIKEAEGGGAGRGKDMANITGHRGKDMSTILQGEEGKENGRPPRPSAGQRRKKRRRLNDLDSDSTMEEEESEDEFRLSDSTEEEEFVVSDNDAESDANSNSDAGSNGSGPRHRSSRTRKPVKRRKGARQPPRRRRRPRGYSDDEEEEEETDEDEEEEIATEGSSEFSDSDLDMSRRRSRRSRKKQVNYCETSESEGSRAGANRNKVKSQRRLASSDSEESFSKGSDNEERERRVSRRADSSEEGSRQRRRRLSLKRRRASEEDDDDDSDSEEEERPVRKRVNRIDSDDDTDDDTDEEKKKKQAPEQAGEEDGFGKGTTPLEYNLVELPPTNGQSPAKVLEGLMNRPGAGAAMSAPDLLAHLGPKAVNVATPVVSIAPNGLGSQEMASQEDDEDDLLGVTDLVDYVCNSEQL